MGNLLNDWQGFCEARKSFDVDHFYTLFHADSSVLTDEQLKAIFVYFPHSEELASRMAGILKVKFSIREGNDYGSSCAENKDKLISFAVADLMQKRVICDKLGNAELCNIIDRVSPVYSDNIDEGHKLLQVDGPNAWLSELVGDYIQSNVPTDKKVLALFEAFYGLTTDYDLVWYAVRPLIDCDDINLDNYFYLWELGGEYVLTDDNLIVSGSSAVK